MLYSEAKHMERESAKIVNHHSRKQKYDRAITFNVYLFLSPSDGDDSIIAPRLNLAGNDDLSA